MTRHLTLGTAGHVDHGKTTLIRALTGINTDRLEEEQRRGISIVLGYATLALSDDLQLSIVDVPGHERFVRTMVGGATGIDYALVCIAADDGPMPQTREHLAILELLGIRTAVIALTKVDLVDASTRARSELAIRELLATTPFAAAPVVPVSAPSGTGLEDLNAALRTAADGVIERAQTGRVRLPIDRSFVLHGIGTVVTGTLWSGTLHAGDTVTIEPGGGEARVRSLEVHGTPVETAGAGSRVAAALVGVERRDTPPGAVLWTGLPATPSYRLDVELSVLNAASALQRGALVEVLHGTAVTQARVVVLAGESIAPGQTGYAQLRLVQPFGALRGDRIVLRRLAPPGTIAGATVLDPRPPRHAGSSASTTRLQLYAEGDPASIARAALSSGATCARDIAMRGLLDLDAAEQALAAVPGVHAFGEWYLGSTTYLAIRTAVEQRLATRLREHPLDPTVLLSALLNETPWRDPLIAQLAADGVVERDGANLRLAGATSNDAANVAAAAIAALVAEPYATHRQTDFVAALPLQSDDAWAILAQLDRAGTVARLPDGLVIDRTAYDQAISIIRALCATRGQVTLAELRDVTASSRKVAQALLERMDADGVTRRTGDVRVLRRSAATTD